MQSKGTSEWRIEGTRLKNPKSPVKKPVITNPELLHPELSFEIVGSAYDVYNALGPGLKEESYPRARAHCLRKKGIAFREQVYVPSRYDNEVMVKRFADFIVKELIVVELKRGDYYSRPHIKQVVDYLKISTLKLAIIINFGSRQVKFKRIPNLY